MMKLYDFQRKALEQVQRRKRCAFYLDMGLGKTFIGAQKAIDLNKDIVLVCQKSKIKDWIEHFEKYYDCNIYDMTQNNEKKRAVKEGSGRNVYIVNYDIVWRRDEFKDKNKHDYTLVLDESSCIQNEQARRTRFITRVLDPENLILLSGTPCNGKYENLWTQVNMLGYKISKHAFWDRYIKYYTMNNNGFPINIVKGYKNIEELKNILRANGAIFMKSEEAFDLPQQVITDMKIESIPEYKKFVKTGITEMKDGSTLVGNTPLTRLLYCRELSSGYNDNKLSAFEDMLDSTDERLIVFYNFDMELTKLMEACKKHGKPISAVNGHGRNLENYEMQENSVTLIQYQAGAMGLNLQKANKAIFFSPPLSCELYLQAFKRIHRIGQNKTCFYYRMMTQFEERIYKVLEKREDYTLKLFEEGK